MLKKMQEILISLFALYYSERFGEEDGRNPFMLARVLDPMLAEIGWRAETEGDKVVLALNGRYHVPQCNKEA